MTEQEITTLAGLAIILMFAFGMWRSFIYKHKDLIKKHNGCKECTCYLDLDVCNKKIRVSDRGVVYLQGHYECPRFMAKVFRESYKASIIVNIHTSRGNQHDRKN